MKVKLGATVVWAAAGFVFAATVAQAIREGSWTPIWQLGWLPAIAVAVLYGPRGRCFRGGRRPTHVDG